eukprot:CAMPEP_0115854372 /NCGR_PEP_ID=MMETSP0287-20121206/13991_1 /TAXON_ID=412157 /ORGANISM="Chrysochromulina rotalis, Strain UIO044" /LENGTH=63 /DNA_ID=CAMNT_0003308489 /DNA_START=395 /DNA_END=583 /DNA_ORIENTATION=-
MQAGLLCVRGSKACDDGRARDVHAHAMRTDREIGLAKRRAHMQQARFNAARPLGGGSVEEIGG